MSEKFDQIGDGKGRGFPWLITLLVFAALGAALWFMMANSQES